MLDGRLGSICRRPLCHAARKRTRKTSLRAQIEVLILLWHCCREACSGDRSENVWERCTGRDGNDCRAYQRRFLYVSAFGACHTARSYWILHEANCFSDGNILARNLLERIINSSFASKSPTHAVELIADELNGKVRRMKLLYEPPSASPELTASIGEHDKHLLFFLALIGKSKAPDWSYCSRAKEAGMLRFYRSGYFHLSRYAHAGYEVARPDKHNQRSRTTDFIALVAPILTVEECHRVDCTDCSPTKCGVYDEFKALFRECSLYTLGNESGDLD
jgi:hypothetical protein